jgi:hypothetical protein
LWDDSRLVSNAHDRPRTAPAEEPGLPLVSADRRAPGGLRRLACTFRDADLEADFRRKSFDDNLLQLRVAHVLGIALWVVWGFVVRGDLGPDQDFDLEMRYGVFIPIVLISLAFSFTRPYRRFWQAASAALILATGFAWIGYVLRIDAMPIDYGYVGVILIMTFSYTLVRLRFVLAAGLSAVLVVGYLAIGLGTNELSRHDLRLPLFYLVSFWLLGMTAAYVLERSARLLFLRERELERERKRSDALLLNVLPKAIVKRLKEHEGEAGRVYRGSPTRSIRRPLCSWTPSASRSKRRAHPRI